MMMDEKICDRAGAGDKEKQPADDTEKGADDTDTVESVCRV